MLVMAAAFCLLLIRLVYLQVIQGPRLNDLSVNNRVRLQSLDPARGLVRDARGVVLADNRPRFDVYLIPRDARPRETILPLLAIFLDMDADQIKSKIGKTAPFKPVLIKEDISRDALAVVESHRYELPGVIVRVKPQRHFPGKGMSAHIVGYLSQISANELKSGRYPKRKPGDFIGKYGIEKEYEEHLAGKHGGRQVEADARGRTVRILRTAPPEPGANVFLTLDSRLQKKAVELLGERAGAVAAIDPGNGRVLAMASSPFFDPNLFVDGMTQKQWNALISDENRPLSNKVIQGEYPPGSTFKMVVAMAGLELGVVQKEPKHFCAGKLHYGDRDFRCWNSRGHGSVDLVQAIAQSCDIYFYKLGLEIGVDRLAEYARACGLGKTTGVGLGDEKDGLVPTREWKKRRTGNSWVPGETLSIAIGQG